MNWSHYPMPRMDAYAHWNLFNKPGGDPSRSEYVQPYVVTFSATGDGQGFVDFLDAHGSTSGTAGFFVSDHQRRANNTSAVVFTDAAGAALLADAGFGAEAIGTPHPTDGFQAPTGSDPGVMADALPSDSVITAVIDFGFAIGNERFNYGPEDSRIEFFWDMNATRRSPGLVLGREFSRADINAHLRRAGAGPLFDGDRFDQGLGLVDFTTLRRKIVARGGSHGTKVLDLAAGRGDGDNIPGETALNARGRNPIIAVQLPSENVEQTDGYGFGGVLMEAIDYVIDRAERLSLRAGRSDDDPLPLVINISFGTYADRHDGHSVLERELSLRAAHPGVRAILIPAGNSLQTQTHARLNAAQMTAGTDLRWQVQPDSKMPGFLQAWLPLGMSGDGMTVRLTPPGIANPPAVTVQAGDHFWEYVGPKGVLARIYVQSDGPPGHERRKITLAIQPTRALDPSHPTSECGGWRVDLQQGDFPDPGEVQCWIERSDTIDGFLPDGRQSYFVDDAYIRLDDRTGDWHVGDTPASKTRRYGTISDFATAVDVVAVGSYRGGDLWPSIYSSADLPGAVANPSLDVAAEGETTRARPNLIVAGNRPGSVAFARGTSFSSALALRVAVREVLADPSVDVPSILHSIAADFETLIGGQPPAPVEKIGHGRLGVPWARSMPRVTR